MHRYTEGGVEDTLSLLMEHVWQIWAQMCRLYDPHTMGRVY